MKLGTVPRGNKTMAYTLKILNDREFESLPYKYVSEAVGCADPKTKTAYVRKTGIKPLDAFVMDHELDELINKTSEHEDSDGIRYGFGKWLTKTFVPESKSGKMIASLAPLALGLLTGGAGFALAPWFGSTMTGALGGALAGGLTNKNHLMGGLMGALGGGGGAAMGANFASGFKGASGGFMGKTASGLKSALGFGGTPSGSSLMTTGGEKVITSNTLNVPGLVGSQAGGLGGSAYSTGGLTGFSGGAGSVGGGAAAGGMGGGALSNTLENLLPKAQALAGSQSGAGAMAGVGESLGAGSTQLSTAGKTPGFWDNIFGAGKEALSGGKNPAQTAVGLGISSLGGLAEQPQIPDLSSSAGVQQFQSLLQGGPQAVQVSDSLKGQLEEEVTGKYDKLKQNLKDKYKQLRPGSDFINDSQYKKDLMELENDEQDEMGNAVSNYQETQYQTQLSGSQYIAGMDTYELMAQTGLDSQSANQFQEWLRTIGGGFMQSGLGMLGGK